jgi:ribosomal protein L11 methyltransferase
VGREEFYEWLWEKFSPSGLIGVHEGTLLSDEAAEQGFETDSWTVDSGEAPRERDWIGQQTEAQAELYFSEKEQAKEAAEFIRKNFSFQIGKLEEQVPEDWDAQWKASFLNAGAGVPIEPFWRVVPPWVESNPSSKSSHEKWIKINPGAGFGTGTHETTQLCLQALGEFTKEGALNGKACLDFGSGSGILSIGLALLGAQVDAVEIDPLAIDNATENATLNQVQNQIRFSKSMSESPQKYQVVIANILKPVLLEFSKPLIHSIESGGLLILSGLIDKDVAPVTQEYSQLLGVPISRVYERGEWRALVFKLA